MVADIADSTLDTRPRLSSPPIPAATESQYLQGLVGQIATARAPVLLVGRYREDAEAMARLIHSRSARREASFVRTRCGLYDGSSAEWRFFGRDRSHARAHVRRFGHHPGDVEQAHGGTLYVEQLQYATLRMQRGLHRLLTGRTFFDPFSCEACESDVRVIASLPTTLGPWIQAGRILPELAEQLSLVAVEVPAHFAISDRPAGLGRRALPY